MPAQPGGGPPEVQFYPGDHAAAFCTSGRAPRERDIWLGRHAASDGSFPLTEVQHLDPAMRIFRAAFTSRSCDSPQCAHSHRLTASCLGPLGPVRDPQLEQPRVVFRSLTTCTDLPAFSPLYRSICLSMPQPLSSTDFAIRVFANFRLLTSPTKMFWYVFTTARLNLWQASCLRRRTCRCKRAACRRWPCLCRAASLY